MSYIKKNIDGKDMIVRTKKHEDEHHGHRINPEKEILLSAPHAVKTALIGGGNKKAEIYTGAVVKHFLDNETIRYGISRIIGESENDYLDRLSKMVGDKNSIRYIIDIHGMSSDHGADVIFGTGGKTHENLGGNTAILNNAIAVSRQLGMTFKVNSEFSAEFETAMAKKIYRMFEDIPVIQMEFSYEFRVYNEDLFIQYFEKILQL